jgi:hypothetical protein
MDILAAITREERKLEKQHHPLLYGRHFSARRMKFPFINVQFSKNHRIIARFRLRERRTNNVVLPTGRATPMPNSVPRKTLAEAARDHIERNKEKSRKTFIGYRTAVNMFVQSCKKKYFDEIRRDDLLDYVSFLQNCKSAKTSGPLGESTVFNYFLKTMVFLNDRGIAEHV